jgi:RNA polymerase sigma-70 factor, ECF subfamily
MIPLRVVRRDPTPAGESGAVGRRPSSLLPWPSADVAPPAAAVPEPRRSLNESDQERFERSVLPHLRAAYSLARWLCRNPADAEDVVQEAFLRAVRFFPRFRDGDGKAWLLTIVRNTFYTTRQQQGRAGLAVGLEEQGAEVEDDAPGPEDLLVQKASRAVLMEALDALPVEFREAVVLRELEGLSYREMAEVLQVPMGTVMSRLARARQRLRERLQAMGRGGPA